MAEFKEGDKIIYGFKHGTVDAVKDGSVCRVIVGCFSVSGHHMLVFRPTPENKQIAEALNNVEISIRELHGINGLNWPYVNDFLETLAVKGMSGQMALTAIMDQATELFNEIKAVSTVKSKFGFNIFR